MKNTKIKKGIFEQIADMSRLTYMMRSFDIIQSVKPNSKLLKKLGNKIKQAKKEINEVE